MHFEQHHHASIKTSNMSHFIGKTHLLLYSFPGLGHIIPFLDLTNLLLSRGLVVTIMITEPDIPLIDPLLSLHHASLHKLVYSEPEVTPSPHHPLIAKIISTQKLFDVIVHWFNSNPSPPKAIVSDFLLGWTSDLASHLGIRHLVFSPSGAFGSSIIHTSWRDIEEIKARNSNEDEKFLIRFDNIPGSPDFSWWEMPQVLRDYKDEDKEYESFRKGMLNNMTSWGILYNTFESLEGVYIDHMKMLMGHDRVWAIGPILPEKDGPIAGRGGSSAVSLDHLLTWLENKPDESVIYICFGSQVVLSEKQMSALVNALELSNVHFILCVKAGCLSSIPSGFKDRVGNRGLIIEGWVPQLLVLRHRAVGSFVTHCGWNSTLEGIASGVMMLTWPMIADQFTNAALLVDQLGIGKRVCEGGSESVPDSVKLARLLDESLSGDRPEKVRVKELSHSANKAVKQGTSTRDLDAFVKLVSEL